MIICEACGYSVSCPMPATGDSETIETLAVEHDPNCALALDSIDTEEDGPWNAPLTKRQMAKVVDLRPPEKRIRRHPELWPS